MALLTESLILDTGIFLFGLLSLLYLFITRNFNHWKKKGVPFLKPTPFVGNFKKIVLGQESIGTCITNSYLQSKGEPFIGIFTFDRPMLIVRDIELVKHILVKDFSHFMDRSFKPDIELDPLAARNLFGLTGLKWKHLRIKLTPTFTSGKMKMMFDMVNACGEELSQYIEESAVKSGEVEMKDAMARYTTDVIATCAFGIQCNSLKNPEAEFRKVLKKVVDFSLWKNIKIAAAFFAPKVVSTLRWRVFEMDIAEFLREAIWSTVAYREKNGVVRKDFLDLLIQIKNKGHIDDDSGNSNGVPTPTLQEQNGSSTKYSLEGDDFVAQAFVFLAAGFETSSTTMTFALYELSLQPNIQKRLREEMKSIVAKHGGKITYEAIREMEYLDMVVAETLRKFPVLPFLDRQALQNYKIPGSEIVLEKGSGLMIPVMGIQRDPQFYPNPDKFDPERFTEENKKKRPHYTYMPFGEGPRICIGSRMGLMQVKVGLIHILSKFEVLPTKATSVPLVFDTNSFLLTPKGGMPLKLNKVY